MKRVLTPARTSHFWRSAAVNSAPLSHRRWAGAPWISIRLESTLPRPHGRRAAAGHDPEAVVAVLIEDRRELSPCCALGRVEDHVDAPDVVDCAVAFTFAQGRRRHFVGPCRQVITGARCGASAAPCAGCSRVPCGAAYHAHAGSHNVDGARPARRPPRSAPSSARLAAPRKPNWSVPAQDNGTPGAANTCPPLPHLGGVALLRRAYHFFEFTSFSTWMFRTWSATIRFKRAFSSSGAL